VSIGRIAEVCESFHAAKGEKGWFVGTGRRRIAMVFSALLAVLIAHPVAAQGPMPTPAQTPTPASNETPTLPVVESPAVKLGETFPLSAAVVDRGGGGERLLTVRLADPLPANAFVLVSAISGDRGRETNRALPTQWELSTEDKSPRVWWIAPPRNDKAAEGERFRIERIEPSAATRAKSPAAAELEIRKLAAAGRVPLDIQQTRDALIVRRGESRILRYNSGHIEPPAGVDSKYGRSAFIHPAWTPSGAVATDQFPPDHLHQSGIFLAYTKTVFEGREPNFWDLLAGKGRVRFEALKGIVAGPVFAEFQVDHAHVDLTGSAEKAVLRETWAVRVWNIGGPADRFWVWDITSTVRCASASPLRLPQYHYGGMAVRGGRDWKTNAVRFRTSEGLGRATGNHSRPRWCDMSGPVEPANADSSFNSNSNSNSNSSSSTKDNDDPSQVSIAGIALLTHPRNFRFPEPLRIHPSMPYMVYTPSQLGAWSIEPGMARTSHYRWVVHDGDLPPESIERIWQAFAR
jgi:hypothetical protein